MELHLVRISKNEILCNREYMNELSDKGVELVDLGMFNFTESEIAEYGSTRVYGLN